MKNLIFTLLLFIPQIALADDYQVPGLSDADRHAINYDTNFYEEGATGTGACSSLPPGTLPSYIPEPFNGAMTAGGKQFNVAPALLAALITEENGTGTDPADVSKWWPQFAKAHPDPNSGWPTNRFGTMGAFQFIPDTWAAYGVDANNDGVKDAQNFTDEAAGAANYVAANGATTDKPTSEWQNAIFRYNHAQWYVDAVMSYYAVYAGGSAAAPSADSATTSTGSCGGAGISPDGFVFPQLTTKSALKGWNPNCTNKYSEMGPGSANPTVTNTGNDGCHHNYLAADIFNATGTPVIAPRPGRIVSAHNSTANGGLSVGYTVRIYSDKALGGDGLWYYLAHMKTSAEGGQSFVTEGQVVKAGDQLGVVGTPADAEGTPQHTHIDISPIDNSFHRGFDGTEGPLLDPMPVLKAAYDKLPN